MRSEGGECTVLGKAVTVGTKKQSGARCCNLANGLSVDRNSPLLSQFQRDRADAALVPGTGL